MVGLSILSRRVISLLSSSGLSLKLSWTCYHKGTYWLFSSFLGPLPSTSEVISFKSKSSLNLALFWVSNSKGYVSVILFLFWAILLVLDLSLPIILSSFPVVFKSYCFPIVFLYNSSTNLSLEFETATLAKFVESAADNLSSSSFLF